ncbi:MAG: hypothetical protein WCB12_12675 [Bryobacteraceae bacterium]
MQISQTNEQIQALSDLQAKCDIQAVTLLSCNVTRAKSGHSFKEPFSVRPALSNVSPSRRGDRILVEVSFEYSAWDASDPPERLFAVNCTFEVAYDLGGGYVPSEDQLSSFGRGTAVFNCWPYAREFLQNITSRMGHQAPALPHLRIVPKKAEPATQHVIEVAPEQAKLPIPETP